MPQLEFKISDERLNNKISDVVRDIYERDESILASVVLLASEFFEHCPDDFCLQHMTSELIVFGGTNRLIWSVRNGFRIDRSYCSQKFIEHFESYKS